MGVCQFFLRGHCRYGDKCWNEHPRGGGNVQRSLTFGGDAHSPPGASSSQYKWVNPSQSPPRGAEGAAGTPQEVVEALPTQMQTWHKSGMWPFSCLALEKSAPSLPDFQDLSPEELRMEAYNAQQTNTFPKYVERVKQLMQEWTAKKEQLCSLTPDLRRKLVQLVEEGRAQLARQSSGTGTGFGGSAPFGSSNPPRGFGSGSTTAGGNPFASPSSGGTSTFGGAGTGSSTFGGTGAFGSSGAGTGAFGASGRPKTFGGSTPFGSTAGTGSTFGGSGTGGAFGSSAGGAGLFGKPQQPAGTGVFGGGSPPAPSAGGAFASPVSSAASSPASSGGGAFGSQAIGGLFGKGLGSPGTSQATPGFGATGAGTFGSGSGGLFGSGTGVFGASPQQPASASGAMPFAKPSGGAPGIFSSQAATSAPGAPGSGLFGSGSATQAQTFGSPGGGTQGGAGLFGQGGGGGVFGGGALAANQAIAGQQPSQSPSAGLFGGGARAPTQETQQLAGAGAGSRAAPGFKTLGEVSRLYTPLEEVSPQDLDQFKARAFTVGKIPMVPPPRELINN